MLPNIRTLVHLEENDFHRVGIPMLSLVVLHVSIVIATRIVDKTYHLNSASCGE